MTASTSQPLPLPDFPASAQVQPVSAQSQSRRVFASMTYFRAIAILLIVLGHTRYVSGLEQTSQLGDIIFGLFSGGTYYFLFIGGFLFAHLELNRFNYPKFLKKKFLWVVCPYLVFSILPVVAALILKDPYPEYFFNGKPGVWHEYVRPALLYLLTGRVLTGYWYIPFITLMFFLTPIFIRLSNQRAGLKLAILALGFCVSMLAQRPVDNISVVQSLIHLWPVYFLGILAYQYREVILERLQNKEWLLLGLLLASMGVIAFIEGGFRLNNLHKPLFEYAGFDLRILQKALTCILLMVFLQRFNGTRNRLLELIASASFCIYFCHPILIYILARLDLNSVLGLPAAAFTLLLVVLIVALACLYGAIMRRLVPRYSRSICGW